MNSIRLRIWPMMAACVAVLACGDDSPEPRQEGRATILNASAAMIAANALSDSPSDDFRVARSRVEGGVSRDDTSYARGLSLGAGKAASVAADQRVTTTRRTAAKALGATLDPAKEVDVASTQQSLDALLSAVQAIAPAATTCNELPSGKAEACAIAFLILEVRRSEGLLTTPDAGAPINTDAGSDAGVAPAGAIACPALRDVTGAREIASKTIAADETWSGKILIKGSNYVNARITIDPGTQIWLDTDASIYFAYTGSAAVFANGSASAPITFCGRIAEKGYWSTITLGKDVTSDSYLRNVLVAEGGGSEASLVLDADVEVNNLQVADSGKDGVAATDFKAGSALLSVRNAAGYPLVLEDQAALARVPKGGTFTGNTNNQVSLTFTKFDTAVTVPNLGLPYVQQNALYQNSGDLVIEAGVEWRLKSDGTLQFAYLDASSVQMKGTAVAPIKFVPVDANSQWGNIIFFNKVNTNSVLSYVEFTGGGRGRNSALQIESAIKLDHVSLYKNATGLELASTGLAAGSTALKISETAGRPIFVDLDGVYSIPTDSVLLGNTIDQVQLNGGTFPRSGTIPNLGVPYYLSNSYYDGNNVAITIAAGTQFVMAADSTLSFGYLGGNTVTAIGTAAQPIRFRGEQALPDFWSGIKLGNNALSNSKLDFVEISDAGGTGAAIKIDAAVQVTNTKISNSTGYCIDGLRSAGIDYAALAAGNTLTCTTGPVNLH
ncbi:MAG TPA: hypothetical protein VFX59_10150 [Polyangiales bacterium]|nr:hypothetical protein [Polyangiales bacterium]